MNFVWKRGGVPLIVFVQGRSQTVCRVFNIKLGLFLDIFAEIGAGAREVSPCLRGPNQKMAFYENSFSQDFPPRHNVRIAVETMSGENSCLSGSLKGSRTGYGDWVGGTVEIA